MNSSACAALAISWTSGVSAGSTTLLDHSRKRSWSSTGMPSSSAMTVIGSGKAKSSTSSMLPRVGDAVDQIVGDLLDPWAELLDHARRERLGHEPPQAAVVVAVLREEVLVHAFVGCNLGDVRFELVVGVECELRVEDEALVVGEQRDDVVVARDEPDRRLAVEARAGGAPGSPPACARTSRGSSP